MSKVELDALTGINNVLYLVTDAWGNITTVFVYRLEDIE